MPELRARHIQVLRSLIDVLTAQAERARCQGLENEARALQDQAQTHSDELAALLQQDAVSKKAG